MNLTLWQLQYTFMYSAIKKLWFASFDCVQNTYVALPYPKQWGPQVERCASISHKAL